MSKDQERVPRKQGLKLHGQPHGSARLVDQERVPRKQGLKLFPGSTTSSTFKMDQERVPRKQGLKPNDDPQYLVARPSIKSEFHENKD